MKNNNFLKVIFGVLFLALVAGAVVLCAVEQYVLGGVIGVFTLAMLITYIVIYNKIVRYKNKVKESLSLVDIHLKLRFDLVPNLVNTVKGYAKHEKEVLIEVTRLRNLAVDATDEKEKLEYSNQLVSQMKTLIAVAESYPELKAQTLFKGLMNQLVEVEDRIVSARRIYDSNVSEYNSLIKTFPSNILAKTYGYSEEVLFRIDANERIAPVITE